MAGNRCVACGYAKLPQATAAAQVYQMLTVAVLVDKSRVLGSADIGEELPSGHGIGEEPGPGFGLEQHELWRRRPAGRAAGLPGSLRALCRDEEDG